MADPVTLTAVSLGATALGGATSTIGTLIGGQSQAQMYQYQAGVARVNQQIAKQNASYARYTGEFEAQRQGLKTRFERGTTIATQSGRGIDIGSGSAEKVVKSETDIGMQDQRTIRASAARRAYGYDIDAEKARVSSEMYSKASSNAKTASYIGAASSILGTIGSVSGKWLQASQAGVFGPGGSGDSGGMGGGEGEWEY